MNVWSDSHWDLKSVGLSIGNVRSKIRSLKQFVRNELHEGKFHTDYNKYDEVDHLEFYVL